MMEWGIKYYEPHWTNSTAELTELLLVASLVGKQIKSVWILWNHEFQEWFEDAPVVICTETEQIELCAYQLDYFSFSFNSIDLSSPVYWCTTEDEEEQPMSWIKANNREIHSLLKQKITEVGIIEYQISEETQEFLDTDEWLLHGISFCLENQWIRVLNGLDCNRLTFEDNIAQSLRYIPVSKQFKRK